jgi:CheY-like chemotaxis protein
MDTKPNELRGARILLVDDTPANLEVLGALLETQGALVSMAPSGAVAQQELLEAVRANLS